MSENVEKKLSKKELKATIESLEQENQALEKEIVKYRRELTLVKVLFRNFYQTMYNRAKTMQKLTTGLNYQLTDRPANEITVEQLSSIVKDLGEETFSDEVVNRALEQNGLRRK